MLNCIGQREAGMDEGEMPDVLGLTHAKVRYHLLVLRNADLIASADQAPDRYIAVAAGF